ncbi:MAG: sulfatase-like hydrolase/transferase [Limisphaerales bacterium]
MKRNTLLFVVIFAIVFSAHAEKRKTENVFLIISDGLRWQEVFRGAEGHLLNKTNGGVLNVDASRKQFWRETPEERREVLMPFFWKEIARHGQLFGNTNKGSIATVANGKKFSYPGYNEVLTGGPDNRINSNDKVPNPNTNIFEWISQQRHFKNRVAVFGNWDVFAYIFNDERSALPIWPVWEKKFVKNEIRTKPVLQKLFQDTTEAMGPDITFDSFLFHAASDYVKEHQPRAVFVGFGETDEWAHSGRYDLYLSAAQHADEFIARLWKTVQSISQYKDKTTFIITCDHGRGSGSENWKHHGVSISGAEYTWLAMLGPDTAPLGERTNCQAITHSQIAATIAALLGENFQFANPKAAPPIIDVPPPNETLQKTGNLSQ